MGCLPGGWVVGSDAMSTPSDPLSRLRTVAKIEGVSFLVLLGIAMPLKYAAGIPEAVKIVGWIHGVLFVALCALIAGAMRRGNLPFKTAAMVFVASLLPFGP